MTAVSTRADEIVQEIVIHAPAEKVFHALTDPKELLAWWAVEGRFKLLEAECDVRVGGKWRFVSTSCANPGSTNEVVGEYLAIERPTLLIYSWIRRAEGLPETIVRWDLNEKDGVTRLRLTHSGLTTEDLKARHSGWPMVVEALRSHLEN